ncbi:MAG TPA: MmgE/PrpD family protein [Methylomirabilota bacterium]|nr:MmgE/PrpD family protein [Methylomirabilota bacterium]
MAQRRLGHVVLGVPSLTPSRARAAIDPLLTGLAGLVADTPAEEIPEPVRRHACLVIADTLGVILGGSEEPEPRRLRTSAERAPGPATILASGFPRVEPWWAIVVNGLAGTTLELDEGHRFARGHPGIHVVPAALAEAERLDVPGAALVGAVVLAYDVAARLGGAGPVRAGMHMHGVHGTVGAAAAVARLRGLDRERTARALGVAAGLTLATSWRTALEGATVRNAYAGVAGATGWLAVDLAEAGITSLPDMLGETFGRISGTGLDAGAVLDGLGRRFEITRNYFKRHACCRYSHPAIEALESLLTGAPLDAAGIVGVRVATSALAATMDAREPVGALAAKFSIPYAIAARLLLGHCGPEAFREPALSDSRVRALARRVEVVEDPALTALVPRLRPARVEVRLADGRVLAAQVDNPAGEFDRPYSLATLREKFRALAAPVLGPVGAGPAWERCLALGEGGRVRQLASGLSGVAGAAG